MYREIFRTHMLLGFSSQTTMRNHAVDVPEGSGDVREIGPKAVPAFEIPVELTTIDEEFYVNEYM